ncbi:hypothetical protein ACFFX1_19080 [Dactylosporangium sucinum]|uniref:Secreted protein n=1 Tax=Dactylosporangium sucinum TaxID=1424081 RepID=A0A917WYU5_9ACTN|nr:hypothetical protein [Dactylosporangium sucinum]GGM47184.1 hypothetical protein GCM10007977_056040 [Dactylosporangium sucinum]
MNLSRKVLTGLAVAATGLAMSVAAPGSPAQADSGFCGVRDTGPAVNNNTSFYYVVRNKCAKKWSMRIVVQGHKLYCQSIPAKGYAAWTTIYFDYNWSIQAC